LCAWLFGINIRIYVKIEDKYEFHEIEHSEPYGGTVALLYRDRNHFEALDVPEKI
jgi:hypothetical protein